MRRLSARSRPLTGSQESPFFHDKERLRGRVVQIRDPHRFRQCSEYYKGRIFCCCEKDRWNLLKPTPQIRYFLHITKNAEILCFRANFGISLSKAAFLWSENDILELRCAIRSDVSSFPHHILVPLFSGFSCIKTVHNFAGDSSTYRSTFGADGIFCTITHSSANFEHFEE